MKLLSLLLVLALSWTFSALGVNGEVQPVASTPTEPPPSATNVPGVEPLGILQNELVAWLPMTSTEMGGLGWSRVPIEVKATTEVLIQREHGWRFADFAIKGALLKFEPVFELGERFTVAAWVKLPMPHRHGAIWQGVPGALLFITDTGLFGWSERDEAQRQYGRFTRPLDGWHHVAVTCDGTHTRAFLDAVEFGSFEEVISRNLASVGNHFRAMHQHWMMASGIAQQFIFSRALTQPEIATVMRVNMPGAADSTPAVE